MAREIGNVRLTISALTLSHLEPTLNASNSQSSLEEFATNDHRGGASQSAGPGPQTWGHDGGLGNRERG